MLHENKTFTEPKLLNLDLECSSLCNLSCQMCPRPKENGTMPIEDIKRLIKEFSDMGGETIKLFHRGEPTTDIRMPELLKYSKDCGLKTMINTNGSFPFNNVFDLCKKLDWLSFSIDDAHNNINDNIFCHLVEAKVARDKDNGYLEYVEVQASENNYFVEYYCTKENIPYKVDLPTKRSDKDNSSEVITGERKYCGFPDWRMIVEYNGDCVMCCVDWEYNNVVGNIYKQSLKEIFYGDKANKLRSELKQGIFTSDICKNCPSRSSYK